MANVNKYLPLFREIAKLRAQHRGGVEIYARRKLGDKNAKVNVEVNWSAFGSVHTGTAEAFQKRLQHAISIAKKLSGKLTEEEFRDLDRQAYEEYWENRKSGPSALGRLF